MPSTKVIRVSDFIKRLIDEAIARNGHTSADSVLRTWYQLSRGYVVTHHWSEEEIDAHFATLKGGPLKKGAGH